jgi:hypothetical protein
VNLENERTLVAAELDALVGSAPDLDAYVRSVTALAAARIAPGTAASITVRRSGQATTVASSDLAAEVCDEVEYLAGEGPCLTAMDRGARLVVPRVAAETRWPAWREASTVAGFGSSAAVPRRVGDGFDMALNLYAPAHDAWDDDTLDRAEMYTDVLARTLDVFLQNGDAPRLAREVRASVAARATIDRAVGIVMVHEGCGPADALRQLQVSALEHGLTVRAEATRVVDELSP